MSAPVTVSSLLIESVPPSVQYGHGGSTTRVPRAISSSGLPEPAFFALNFASHAVSRWPQTLTASCAGDSASVMKNLAQRLGKVPIWIFHGEVDQVVNVNGSREPAAALKAAGADVRYSELLGLNHNSWDAAYASDEFVRWLFAQQRP